MARITICDKCKKIITNPIHKKEVKIDDDKYTELIYQSNNKSSSDSGFCFHYTYDICLDCMKKIIQDF